MPKKRVNITCPFCGAKRRISQIKGTGTLYFLGMKIPLGPFECGCGALWYDGMEDVEEVP